MTNLKMATANHSVPSAPWSETHNTSN